MDRVSYCKNVLTIKKQDENLFSKKETYICHTNIINIIYKQAFERKYIPEQIDY